MKIQDVEAMARSAGLLHDGQQIRQAKPFRTARTELGVVFSRDGFGPGAPCYWSLPEGTTSADPIGAKSDTIGAHHKKRAPMDNEDGGNSQTPGDALDIPPSLRRCEQCGAPSDPSKGAVTARDFGGIQHWLHARCDFEF